MVKQVSVSMDVHDVRGIQAIRHMVGLVDFVDSTFVRCRWNKCWTEPGANHVSPATVSALLQRYTAPIVIQDSSNEAQRADFLITRHWICHVLWDLGFRHGYMDEKNAVAEMRPNYANVIARDTSVTCGTFDPVSLECHGVGLVSIVISLIKFSRIAYIY
jgi:hypothetical protein